MRNGSIPGAHGRVRPLTLLGDTALHAPCADITDFGPELAALVEDLFATMYAARGVGLAANQVGESLRVFVYDCPDDEDVRHLGHVVNPRLVEADGVVVRGPEGCLSLPGLEAGTERHDHAVVEGFTVTGEPVTVHGTGFFARCLQHECDHLDGRVYADHVSGWRRRKLLRQLSKTSWHRPGRALADGSVGETGRDFPGGSLRERVRGLPDGSSRETGRGVSGGASLETGRGLPGGSPRERGGDLPGGSPR